MAWGPSGTPGVGAGLTATPETPRPRASSCCTMTPPNEWPIRIGFSGRARMMRVEVVDDAALADAGKFGGRVGAEGRGGAIVERPVGGEDGVALGFVAGLHIFPAEGC